MSNYKLKYTFHKVLAEACTAISTVKFVAFTKVCIACSADEVLDDACAAANYLHVYLK